MAFLDPKKPLATCVVESCDGCPVHGTLHCHFQARDLAHFLLIVSPSFLLGGAGILHVGPWYLVPWLAIVLGYFGLLEIRVMCSHCPHYAEPGHSLQCWANYGSPKLWKYRPGPMSRVEKSLFLGGFAAVWGYPLVFLLGGMQWFLLAVYALASAGFFATLKIHLCSQCMNFACPLNSVQDETRRAFFARNPQIAQAWGVVIRD
jgi:hypothetical protein